LPWWTNSKETCFQTNSLWTIESLDSHQGCKVGGKMSDSNSLTKSEWSLAVNHFVATTTQWKLWYTARIFCFNKSFKRNCTISTGIHNLGVWHTKGVGQKNPTLTPSVVETLTLPKKHQLRNPDSHSNTQYY